MKTINDDPEGFFDSGGWSFLDPDSEVGIIFPGRIVACTCNYKYQLSCTHVLMCVCVCVCVCMRE